MISKLRNFARKLNDDTAGAMSVEKILILACIAIPILIILYLFRITIIGWFNDNSAKLSPT